MDVVARRLDGPVVVSNITDGAKRRVESIQAVIEPDLLYPLLRGRDVSRWGAKPSASILMVQDPVKRRGYEEHWVKVAYPKTYAYLKRFEEPLLERKDRGTRGLIEGGAPFYSMLGVGEYTFAPYKVVWREVAHRLDAAVTGPADPGGIGMKATIPDHTVILIACDELDEAHYLCAALNSSPSRFVVQNYIVLHPDPHVLDRVAIPRFDPANVTHVRLAELSRRAHEAKGCSDGGAIRLIEAEVDDAARVLWGLTTEELAEIQQSLAELE